MSKKKLATILAVLAVVSSPFLLSYWEETWYPHGRQTKVINPGSAPIAHRLSTVPQVQDWTVDESASESFNLFTPKDMPS